MNTILCSLVIGLCFEAVNTTILPRYESAFDDLQNDIHKREWMGGNIKLTSNIPLGSGGFTIVLPGETKDGTLVAIKVASDDEEGVEFYDQEYKCYEKMNATRDIACQNYGIPFVYHTGRLLNHKTMAMTMLDQRISDLLKTYNYAMPRDSVLIIFRDMIRTLKFMHSKGVLHLDIHPGNIMTKGANVFLFDFNVSVVKKYAGNRVRWCPCLGRFEEWEATECHDMLRLFITMTGLVKVKGCKIAEDLLESKKIKISEIKVKMKKEMLLKNMTHPDLAEVFAEFWFDTVEAIKEKRLPKYDYLFKIFDDLLYKGRNRSERIVFEWLTPAERVVAIAESVPSIESIVFSEKTAH